MNKIWIAAIVAVPLFLFGCSGSDKPFGDQPKADLSRDNGPPPPRGMNNPEVQKMKEKMAKGSG
jgi:hypothetical protein